MKKILVATDFSDSSQAAIRQALWLAARVGAEVTVVHVLEDVRRELCDLPAETRRELFGGDIERFERALRSKAAEKIDSQLQPLRRSDVKISHAVLLGTPFVEIIHAVQQEGFELVIAGTRGQTGLKRFLVGSTAERLVRQCPCPVWIVKAGQDEPVRSILVPVDFSEVSGKTLRLAAWLGSPDAQIHVLHIVDVPGETALLFQEETTEEEMKRYRIRVRRNAHKRLREFVQAQEPSISPAKLRLGRGEPSRAIASRARQTKADVIVMGSLARSGLPGFLIGNTAEKILRTADCSIFAVKPDDFVSPIEPAFWRLRPDSEPPNNLAPVQPLHAADPRAAGQAAADELAQPPPQVEELPAR